MHFPLGINVHMLAHSTLLPNLYLTVLFSTVGRAWLYQALADHLLESYVRCYIDNARIVKRYYVHDALLLDEQVSEGVSYFGLSTF